MSHFISQQDADFFFGMEIPTPHLYLYVEGYGEKWAIPADLLLKVEGNDIYEMMFVFLKYCNVKQLPLITKTLLI